MSVTELGFVIDSRPGPAWHSRKKNHEDATKAGMHSCRSTRSSTAVLRHRVSSTWSHSPGLLTRAWVTEPIESMGSS